MKVRFDTRLVDAVISAEYDKVYSDPIFLQLKRHAEEFMQRAVTAEEYLDQLLHIDGIDILANVKRIKNNLDVMLSVDADKLIEDIAGYLPRKAIESVDLITVYPVIGIAGLAMDDFIAIDPAPYPWYPEDGSNEERYRENYVAATLRHELHHIGCFMLHGKTDISEIKDIKMLAVDYAHEIQLEGGAKLCEKQDACAPLTEDENRQLDEAVKIYIPLIYEWLERENVGITDNDMDRYFELWGESKPAYWMGELLCRRGISKGIFRNVADCMEALPIGWIEKVLE